MSFFTLGVTMIIHFQAVASNSFPTGTKYMCWKSLTKVLTHTALHTHPLSLVLGMNLVSHICWKALLLRYIPSMYLISWE